MARHPSRPRGHRGSDQPDDAFVATIDRVVAWIQSNTRLVVIGVVVLTLLIAGFFYYRTVQRTVDAEAANRFSELQGTIATGNAPLAIRELNTFVNRFGSTEPGRHARLILADLLLAQNQPDQAVEALGDMPRNIDRPLGLPAARLQAAAFEMMDQPDQAVDAYRRIADRARFRFERREALADAARVRLQNGDPGAAADLYARILDTFDENEPGRGYYEMWLAEARAAAQNPATAAAPGPPAEPAAVDSPPGA